MAKVEIMLMPWNGDHAAADDEPTVILAEAVTRVDGELFAQPSSVRLVIDGFAQVEITKPPRELWERYADPDSHLLGSSSDLLILPVTELTITRRGT